MPHAGVDAPLHQFRTGTRSRIRSPIAPKNDDPGDAEIAAQDEEERTGCDCRHRRPIAVKRHAQHNHRG